MEAAGTKKKIKKITHRKRNLFWHPKWFQCLMFGIICMFPRQLPKIPPAAAEAGSQSIPESCRVHPFTPSWQGHHPHTPAYVGWHRLSPTQACPPSGKWKKKKKSHRFKKVSSASEGWLCGFPSSSSPQRSFLTLVVGEEHQKRPPLWSALPAPLPIVPHPIRAEPWVM